MESHRLWNAWHMEYCKTPWTCTNSQKNFWSCRSARQASRMLLHRKYFLSAGAYPECFAIPAARRSLTVQHWRMLEHLGRACCFASHTFRQQAAWRPMVQTPIKAKSAWLCQRYHAGFCKIQNYFYHWPFQRLILHAEWSSKHIPGDNARCAR